MKKRYYGKKNDEFIVTFRIVDYVPLDEGFRVFAKGQYKKECWAWEPKIFKTEKDAELAIFNYLNAHLFTGRIDSYTVTEKILN